MAASLISYPIPTPHSAPQGIAAGPEGALWFTDSLSHTIGRIGTGGTITNYPAPPINFENTGTTGIALGPDSALWFTEFGAGMAGEAVFLSANLIAGRTGGHLGPGADGTSQFQRHHVRARRGRENLPERHRLSRADIRHDRFHRVFWLYGNDCGTTADAIRISHISRCRRHQRKDRRRKFLDHLRIGFQPGLRPARRNVHRLRILGTRPSIPCRSILGVRIFSSAPWLPT